MKNSAGIIAAFLGGVVVGGAVALLLAPDSGENTRKKVVDFLEKKGIKITDDEADELIGEPDSTDKQQ